MKNTFHPIRITNILEIILILLFILLFLFPFVSQGQSARQEPPKSIKHQQFRLNRYVVMGSATLISGALDGTLESIKFHYEDGFRARFKSMDDQFWNPDLSWKNKYKDGNAALGPKFYGSTTLFVCTTDAYHALRTAKNAVNTFTVIYYFDKQGRNAITRSGFKQAIVDALVLSLIRNIGFELTYGYLFQQRGAY